MFIFFGCLMWMPLLGPLPTPGLVRHRLEARLRVAVRFTGIVLGNVFMWSGSVFYPVYAQGEALARHLPAHRPERRRGDHDGRGHLRLAGGIRLAVLPQAAQEGSERQRLLDLAQERGIALDEARAARAVAAGRGGSAGAAPADRPRRAWLRLRSADRLRAWLVTGAAGHGIAALATRARSRPGPGDAPEPRLSDHLGSAR